MYEQIKPKICLIFRFEISKHLNGFLDGFFSRCTSFQGRNPPLVTHACTRAHTYNIHTHTCTHTHTHRDTDTHTHAHTRTCTYTHTHTHTHAHTRTCTHTHTHTYNAMKLFNNNSRGIISTAVYSMYCTFATFMTLLLPHMLVQ